LFTDIVGSTQRAAHLGDAAWRHILDRHDELVREQVSLHRGRFIESTGDGALATFDGPSRAIDCALALHAATKPLGISLRPDFTPAKWNCATTAVSADWPCISALG
jgi:class 3 adenylate cyclase